MKSLAIFLISFLIGSFAIADEKSPIDLGELKVKGDVRRPSIEFYHLSSMHSSQLQRLSELSFKQFEDELLKPATGKDRREDTQ